MSDDVEFPEDVWVIEGHNGRGRFFLLLQQLGSRHLTPQQVVDSATARTNDLEIDERTGADGRPTLATRTNPRYVASQFRSDELRRRR